MSSFYRILPTSRSVRPVSGQPFERREMQRNKPTLEKKLARLRSAQGRMPTKRAGDCSEPDVAVGDDVWPVIDELLHDWLYEA